MGDGIMVYIYNIVEKIYIYTTSVHHLSQQLPNNDWNNYNYDNNHNNNNYNSNNNIIIATTIIIIVIIIMIIATTIIIVVIINE